MTLRRMNMTANLVEWWTYATKMWIAHKPYSVSITADYELEYIRDHDIFMKNHVNRPLVVSVPSTCEVSNIATYERPKHHYLGQFQCLRISTFSQSSIACAFPSKSSQGEAGLLIFLFQSFILFSQTMNNRYFDEKQKMGLYSCLTPNEKIVLHDFTQGN